MANKVNKVKVAKPSQNGTPKGGGGLFIKHEELQQLDKFIDQLPTMYGKVLLNFFGTLHQLRAKEAQEAKGKGANEDTKG